MSKRMEYIISNGRIPVVFSEFQTHTDVAYALFGKNVKSAGFCYINDDRKYTCYGESVSLNLKANTVEDSRILNQTFGLEEAF